MKLGHTFTKLFLFLILPFLFFASCINNSDEEKVAPPSIVDIELTKENIVGKWELWYRTKSLTSKELNINSQYRYYDLDGFSITFEGTKTTYEVDGVTFDADGVYYEHNAFGMETIKGAYTLLEKKDKPKEYDKIQFNFPSKKTGIDTVSVAYVSNLSKERLVHRELYGGKSQGRAYDVLDMYHYRNVKNAPNYVFPNFYKYIIDESKLLGYWKLENTVNKVNGVTQPEDKKEYGTITEFVIEKGERVFREYKKDTNTPGKEGKYRIVDDVIHMYYSTEEKGKKVNKSFAYRITKWSSGTTEMFTEGYEDRDEDNTLQARDSKSIHVKVAAFPY